MYHNIIVLADVLHINMLLYNTSITRIYSTAVWHVDNFKYTLVYSSVLSDCCAMYIFSYDFRVIHAIDWMRKQFNPDPSIYTQHYCLPQGHWKLPKNGAVTGHSIRGCVAVDSVSALSTDKISPFFSCEVQRHMKRKTLGMKSGQLRLPQMPHFRWLYTTRVLGDNQSYLPAHF